MKISVIIPVYNVEPYLRECIDSVIGQSYKDVEIILVDDGSQDQSPKICDEYADNNPCITVIHKPNGGLSDARNAGVEIATGDYVVFLDSDDWWNGNDALEKAVELLDEEPDILFFDRVTYCDNGKLIYPKGMPLSAINHLDFTNALGVLMKAGKFIPSACNKFVRLSILKNHLIKFEKGLICEDIEWTYQILQYARILRGFDVPFYGYRRRNGSITANVKAKTINDLLYVIEKWTTILLKESLTEQIRYLLLGYLNYQFCIANGQVVRIRKEERKNFEDRFQQLKWLLNYDINKKTHMVRMLSLCIGLKNVRRLLRFYIWIKNKGFKIQ